MMRKTMEGNVCPKCGGAIDPSLSICSACGETILAQDNAPIKGKRIKGFFGAFFSAFFSLLMTASTVLLVLLLFLHALNENVRLPAIGPISGDWLAAFFDSRYSIILGGALVLIPLLIIILISTHRIRRAFLSIGVSSITSALFSVALGFIGPYAIKLFAGDWQDILVNSTAVLRDFSVVCAIILIIIGAVCLSIYSCITVVKGAEYEKNN